MLCIIIINLIYKWVFFITIAGQEGWWGWLQQGDRGGGTPAAAEQGPHRPHQSTHSTGRW